MSKLVKALIAVGATAVVCGAVLIFLKRET
jgi:hypothetical protein